jgi:predicted nucleotidyltransferase
VTKKGQRYPKTTPKSLSDANLGFFYRLNTKIRVDFIFSFTEYEQQAIGRARKVLMDNVEINFASPEDVIIHKCFAQRPRDLEDIRGILLKKPELDVEYMKKWLKEFDRAIPEEHFTDTLNILLDE